MTKERNPEKNKVQDPETAGVCRNVKRGQVVVKDKKRIH
jgi:hypothetical protein